MADAFLFADVALMVTLELDLLKTETEVETGAVSGAPAEQHREGFAGRWAEIRQAADMLAAQLGTGLAEAFARLRAHAYAHDLRLADVARDVLARRLRFETG
ncbi:hypothetical protein GCM10010517_61200 [Streptosporangium fragile]|uniref:ANTAR domain-containing protein n=1 Tax=Streptosporangium fragile TaxID=46186 RepID=A0ABP6IP34_9ACTN